MTTWYAKTVERSHQGLVYDEMTGENIAVTYKAKNAPIAAAAPDMYSALEASNEFIRRMINEGFIHPSDLQEAGEIQANNYTAIAKAKGE